MPEQGQHSSPVDPQFVQKLKGNISGIFFASVSGYTPEKIEQEFRKAITHDDLVADETFMDNLMFLVRKREVKSLHDDVDRMLMKGLKPRAEVSTMKTLYALGSQNDRLKVDDRLSSHLENQLKRGEMAPSPYLEWSERIGGSKTLEVLKRVNEEASARQKQIEKASPDDHTKIADMDQMRSSAENKAYYLSLKLNLMAMGESERAAPMVKYYLQRTPFLGFMGYKELVNKPTPVTIEAVRVFIDGRLTELLPVNGLTPEHRTQLLRDYKLRGLLLLQAMKAKLTTDEEKFLAEHAKLLEDRKEFSQDGYDWEDVLDRN